MLSFAAAALALASSVIAAPADTPDVHTITFNNNCGYGNPVWNTPSNATKNGAGNAWAAVVSGVAWLDVDGCGPHGENCAVVEFTLDNPSGAATADISLVGTHANYSEEISIQIYGNQCYDILTCDSADCKDAIHDSSASSPLIRCTDQFNAGLTVDFCSAILY